MHPGPCPVQVKEGAKGLPCEGWGRLAVSAENAASGYAPWAYDTENAERLWAESERLTGASFG